MKKQKEPSIKIGICIPSRGDCVMQTAFDLATMCAYDAKNRIGNQALFTVNGTFIFDQREKLAEVALDQGCTHLLWIDSDMRFPKDTIERLLFRNKDIVGVNAVTRQFPVKPTAKYLLIDEKEKTATWKQVVSKGKVGLEKVSSVGFGVVMIRAEVFRKTPKPWFWFEQLPGEKVLGEDVYFCIKAADAGFDTYVDHDLSNKIGHVGLHTYSWDDYGSGDVLGSEDINR